MTVSTVTAMLVLPSEAYNVLVSRVIPHPHRTLKFAPYDTLYNSRLQK